MDKVDEFIETYSKKGVLIDSGLLLLLFVGGCDRSRIRAFRRTASFTEEDFDLLLGIVRRFDTVVTTPHILTEVSNLLGQLPTDLHGVHYAFFSKIAGRLDERYTRSETLASRDSFPKFGLTDTAIIEDSRGKYLVLTVDLPLYSYLLGQGIDAINFHHLRTIGLFP